MIGGAADLVESTYTEFEGGGLFSARWAGRNIAFGIREHAMGAIVNGIAVHGGCVKPYGSTFLIFSDYMRPVGAALGADGAAGASGRGRTTRSGSARTGRRTSRSRRYAALRAIPNLWFIRPADANETAYAWKVALERTDGPVALSLSRQKVPTLDRTELAPASGLERGAYTLWESTDSPDLILIATGSEVALALDAGRKLADDGHRRARRLDAVLGALRGAAGRVPRRGAAARRHGAALDRGRRRARLERVGRRPRRLDLDRALRRVGARRADSVPRAEFGFNRRQRRLRRVCSRQLLLSEVGVRRAASRGRVRSPTGVAPSRREGRVASTTRCTCGREPTTSIDLGTDTDAVRIDYPDKAREVGEAIQRGDAERGVLVCGSGVGAAVAACKITGIRAAICHDPYSAHQGVEHDDMNVLCLGSEVVGPVARARARRRIPRARRSTAASATSRASRRSPQMEKEMKDGQVTSA